MIFFFQQKRNLHRINEFSIKSKSSSPAGHVAPSVEGGDLEHGEEGPPEAPKQLARARALVAAAVLGGGVGEELHGEDGVDGLEDEDEGEGVEDPGHGGGERPDEAQEGGDPLEEAEDADGADAAEHLRAAHQRGQEEAAGDHERVEPVPPVADEVEQKRAVEVEKELDGEDPVEELPNYVKYGGCRGAVGRLGLCFCYCDNKAGGDQTSSD